MRLIGQPPPGPGPPPGGRRTTTWPPPGPMKTPLPFPELPLPEPTVTARGMFTTTCSPTVSPLVIWVSPPDVSPVVTSLATRWPLMIVYTTVFPPDTRTAAAGTARALVSWREMIEAVAEAPSYRPDGVPVTWMTRGKVATRELVEAMRPIEATVPRTGPAAPSVVITAWSPVD